MSACVGFILSGFSGGARAELDSADGTKSPLSVSASGATGTSSMKANGWIISAVGSDSGNLIRGVLFVYGRFLRTSPHGISPSFINLLVHSFSEISHNLASWSVSVTAVTDSFPWKNIHTKSSVSSRPSGFLGILGFRGHVFVSSHSSRGTQNT